MMDDKERKKPDPDDGGEGSPGIALGLCFGSAFGVLAWVLTGSIIWLPIGVAVGLGLGTTFCNKEK